MMRCLKLVVIQAMKDLIQWIVVDVHSLRYPGHPPYLIAFFRSPKAFSSDSTRTGLIK